MRTRSLAILSLLATVGLIATAALPAEASNPTLHVYTFGTFTLKPGASVTLYTGKGTNTSSKRYWGRASYVWNNTGDEAYLKNTSGTTKDTCSWPSEANGKQVTC